MNLKPIGIIHSPFKTRQEAPRQGRLSREEICLEIFPAFSAALKEIDTVSHLFLLYWGDRSDRQVLQSKTPFREEPVGVFASRSPDRPNPIALCAADLIRRDGLRLFVRGVDALDGSPLLDIKVYSSGIDSLENTRSWFQNTDAVIKQEQQPDV